MRALFAAVALIACSLVHAATCNIAEFADKPPVTYQAAGVPVLVTQTVTYTTASVQSAQFQPTTVLIRISCDATAYVVFGATPTATTAAMRLNSGQPEYFTIKPANVAPYVKLRLAVIGP